jgi:hypothetical protein
MALLALWSYWSQEVRLYKKRQKNFKQQPSQNQCIKKYFQKRFIKALRE